MAGISGEYLKQFASDLTVLERQHATLEDFTKYQFYTFVIYNDLNGLYLLDAIPDRGERFTLASGSKLEILKCMTALLNYFKKVEE